MTTQTPSPSGEAVNSFRILVVDDNRANRFVLKTLLTQLGHSVCEATDGAEALQIVQQAPPQVIFTDILMPVMSGRELAQAIRADERLSQIRLVAVTGQDAKDGAMELTPLFDHCVTKPVEIHRVVELLKVLSTERN